MVITELKVDATLSPLLHESILSATHNLQKCCSAVLQIVVYAEFKRSQTLLRSRTDSVLFSVHYGQGGKSLRVTGG